MFGDFCTQKLQSMKISVVKLEKWTFIHHLLKQSKTICGSQMLQNFWKITKVSLNSWKKWELLEETLVRKTNQQQWLTLMPHAMLTDILILRINQLEIISDLLVMLKVDLILVQKIYQIMKPLLIFIHSQNFKLNLEMVWVQLLKLKSTIENMVTLKLNILRKWMIPRKTHGNVEKVPNRAASAMVLYGMVQALHQILRNQLKLGIRWENGNHLPRNLKNGCHVPMQTSEVTHGLNKKNNAGVKINQLTNHGNVLKMEKNAFVMEVG